jgi:hypothetical protein
MVLAYLLMDVIHKNRAALVGILAVAAVLLMDTANTYLQYNYLPGLTGSLASPANALRGVGRCLYAPRVLVLHPSPSAPAPVLLSLTAKTETLAAR